MAIDLLNYRSLEELQFSWYLDELKENGYIHEYYYESTTFLLIDEIKTHWLKKTSKSSKIEEAHLTHKLEYTPDFKILFTEKASGCICNGVASKKRPYFLHCMEDEHTGLIVAYVDVKGSAKNGQNKSNFSQFSFPLKQKIMLLLLNIYVQKIIPEKLFKSTFLPKRMLLTDSGQRERKSDKYNNCKNLTEYIDSIS